MKRRAFILQLGAGLAAAALRGLGQTPAGDAEQERMAAAVIPQKRKRPIVHPGILQTHSDLEFMKTKIKAGEGPWKSSWNVWRTSSGASLDFVPRPFVHVIRGAYAAGRRGGVELSESATAANYHVMQWYVTGNEAHARKAIEIFDAWSDTLADFFENDAMLLAGWVIRSRAGGHC
jgi:hypothetical protein